MRTALLTALAVFSFVLVPACVGDDPALTATNGDGGVGTTCDATKACPGGAPCVDGFCCDSTCTGTCEACNVPGKEGRCSPASGKPLHGTCEGDATGPCAGSCDGKSGAACTYPEVACGAQSCAGGTAILAPTCKAGTCQVAETQLCSLGCLEDGCLGVKQVAGGRDFACAVLTDKHVRCWGNNDAGQLGQFTSSPHLVPTPMEVGGVASAEMVAAASGAICILLTDKTVKCMGSNSVGQLGNGTTDTNRHVTPELIPGLTDVVFVGGSSGGHLCAITTSGTVKCWGSNYDGQIGDGTVTAAPKTSPTTVCQPGGASCTPSSGATFVAGGDNHTCATFAGGQVACWGNNSAGQLGQAPSPPNDGAPNPVPTFVPNLTATYLTAGNAVTCAASEGQAKCFGGNGLGVLGNGTQEISNHVPQPVCTKADCSAHLTEVTGVATFDESACAVAGGAVKCWGTNAGGQLGDGNGTASQSYAATSAIASGAVYVRSVGPVNMAIVVDRANRDLRCWGNESGGECGSGLAPGDRKTPISPKW